MLGRDERAELRSATWRGDGAGVIHLLTEGPWPEDSLQLIGDGLLVALRQQTDGAEELADRCAAVLRARGWDGDEELADSLQARLGRVPTRLLKPLHIDLEELATVLEGDPLHGGGRIDLTTGEVWPQAAIDYARETGDIGEDDDDDPERWLWVDCEGSRPGYRDMEWFIADLDDADLAQRLDIAIGGRGAFRRFKDTLAAWPDLTARWFAFAEDRQRGRARAWLSEEGYAASPPTPRG